MFNKSDLSRNECMLKGGQAKRGYDWWWHSLTARHAETGEEQAFIVEFFLCNPALGGEEPILGQLPENKANKRKPSYLMIKVGAWGENGVQLHRFFGWKKIEVHYKKPYHVRADDCYIDDTQTFGSVKVTPEEAAAHPEYMCDSGEISWDLKIDKKIAYNVGYGGNRLLRAMQIFQMYWHAEGMKTAYEGEIIWNGQKYLVTPDTCYGYADKNWGKDFTSPWVWLSSNNLTSKITGKKLENSVFDIGGGCPKIGFIALKRKLLSAFYYEGKEYEFNFAKFWHGVRTKFECTETDTQVIWHVEQKTWRNRMVTDITCEKKDMLFVNYEAPNGAKKHNRLWNGGNGKGMIQLYHKGKLIDEIWAENVGCEYGEYDKE